MSVNESMAVDFWRAIQHGNEQLAQEIGRGMHVLPVSSPAFSFTDVAPLTEVDTSLALVAPAGAEGTSDLLSTQAVEPSTPAPCLEAWNSDMLVNVKSVTERSICGARIGAPKKGEDSKLDFAACGYDRQECSTLSHMSDSTARVTLPPNQGHALVICLRAKSPQSKLAVFSRPTLPIAQFPSTSQRGIVEILSRITLSARAWKLLFEMHEGPIWMLSLVAAPTFAAATPRISRLHEEGGIPGITIPSPTIGQGGYKDEEFFDRPVPSEEEPSMAKPPMTRAAVDELIHSCRRMQEQGRGRRVCHVPDPIWPQTLRIRLPQEEARHEPPLHC